MLAVCRMRRPCVSVGESDVLSCVRKSCRYEPSRLGDCLLKRQPHPRAALSVVCAAEALTGARDQLLIALPFGQKHPKAKPAFLVFGDSPKTGCCTLVATQVQRTRDAGEAIDLHAPVSCCNGVRERLAKAAQRCVGIRTVEREVSKAVQCTSQHLVEAELSSTHRRLFKNALAILDVAAVAVGVAQPVELSQSCGLVAGLLEQRQRLLMVGNSAVEVATAPCDTRQPAERGTELLRIVLCAAQFEPFPPEPLRFVNVVVRVVGDSTRRRKSRRAHLQRESRVIDGRIFEPVRGIPKLRPVQPESPEGRPDTECTFAPATFE